MFASGARATLARSGAVDGRPARRRDPRVDPRARPRRRAQARAIGPRRRRRQRPAHRRAPAMSAAHRDEWVRDDREDVGTAASLAGLQLGAGVSEAVERVVSRASRRSPATRSRRSSTTSPCRRCATPPTSQHAPRSRNHQRRRPSRRSCTSRTSRRSSASCSHRCIAAAWPATARHGVASGGATPRPSSASKRSGAPGSTCAWIPRRARRSGCATTSTTTCASYGRRRTLQRLHPGQARRTPRTAAPRGASAWVLRCNVAAPRPVGTVDGAIR